MLASLSSARVVVSVKSVPISLSGANFTTAKTTTNKSAKTAMPIVAKSFLLSGSRGFFSLGCFGSFGGFSFLTFSGLGSFNFFSFGCFGSRIFFSLGCFGAFSFFFFLDFCFSPDICLTDFIAGSTISSLLRSFSEITG